MARELVQIREAWHHQESQLRDTIDLNQRLNRSLIEIEQHSLLQKQQQQTPGSLSETFIVHPSRISGN